MRGEGVITTQRAGRGGGATANAQAARRTAAAQRPSARKTRPQPSPLARARGGAWTWRRAMLFVPLALKLLLAVAFGLLLFVGYQRAASASFFRVAVVDVSGERRASRQEIEAAATAAARDGVWRADLEEISRRVRRLPWVRTAVVTRVLPDGLRVRVTEREPRVIARNEAGRFVWVDDDGVALGPASADGEDFTVRGLEDADRSTPENARRVALALELKQEWEMAGLSGRVSEVNLADLKDVRVYLTGADAGVEIQILGGDHARLFRDAVRALEQERQTPLGRFVNYILMRPGKDPTFGYRDEATARQAQAAAAAAQGEPAREAKAEAPREAAAPRPRAPETKPKRHEREKRDERERPRDAGSRPTGEATRPRRAG